MRCARLSSTSTKQERMALHSVKMEMKRQRNQQQGPTGYGYPISENKAAREEAEAGEQ
jgi:hypothetical protein